MQTKTSDILFKIQEKSLKNGDKAFILIDSEGYMCGVYATEQDAEKAIPAIKRNITQGYVPKSVLFKKSNRQQNKQMSNKK